MTETLERVKEELLYHYNHCKNAANMATTRNYSLMQDAYAEAYKHAAAIVEKELNK